MKKYLLLVINILLFTGCSKKDNTLLNTVTVNTSVNPETFILTGSDSYKMEARINNNGLIYGFTSDYYFSTPDFFNTFQYYDTYYGFGDDGYYDGQNILSVYGAGNDYSDNVLKFDQSNDYGKSFQTVFNKPYDDAVWGGTNNATGKNNFFKTFFYAQGDGFICSQFKSSNLSLAPSAIRVYRYLNNNVTFLSTFGISAYEPLFLSFPTNTAGYMIVENHGSWPGQFLLFRTVDGGYSWVQSGVLPVQPGNSYSVTGMQIFYPQSVVIRVYGNHEQFAVSHDHGATWNLIDLYNPDHYDTKFQFANPFVIMALVPGPGMDNYGPLADIYKITDFETSYPVWTKMNESQLYGSDIYFLNETAGLAMARNILQITVDAGKTWNILLFPDLDFY